MLISSASIKSTRLSGHSKEEAESAQKKKKKEKEKRIQPDPAAFFLRKMVFVKDKTLNNEARGNLSLNTGVCGTGAFSSSSLIYFTKEKSSVLDVTHVQTIGPGCTQT